MSSSKRLAFALLWPALLAIAGWAISQRLQLSGDLRKFMPTRRRNRRAAKPDAASAADNDAFSALSIGVRQ